jgi:hypothetical protein
MRDIREDAIFFCGVDGARFFLTKGKYSLYYRCPKYELKNREGDEVVCMNRLSIDDQELLFSELEDLDDEDKIKEGLTGQIRHLLYEIVDVNEDYIKVYVINKNKIKLD